MKKKKLSKVPRVTYNKFENSLERDSWFGDTFSNLGIPNQIEEVRMTYIKWDSYHDSSHFYSYNRKIFFYNENNQE